MIKIIKSLKIELVTLLTHSRLIFSTSLINGKRYIEHSNICARRCHNAEIIIKKKLENRKHNLILKNFFQISFQFDKEFRD